MDEEDELREIPVNLSWELQLRLVPETIQMRGENHCHGSTNYTFCTKQRAYVFNLESR
jgi:hypothetical protein